MIFNIVRSKSPLSRIDVSRLSKISISTVGRIVAELMEHGYIYEVKDKKPTVGKKGLLLKICRSSFFTIGIEINEKYIKIGLVDARSKLQFYEHYENKVGTEVCRLVDCICNIVFAFIAKNSINKDSVKVVGIAIPAIVNANTSTVVSSASFNWSNVALGERMTQQLGILTIVDNDVKTIAIAEYAFGSAKNSSSVSVLCFGEGLGAALMIDGKVYRGINNSAGEIGHYSIDANGMLCSCGKMGCLQTYISEKSILSEANKYKKMSHIGEVFEARFRNEVWAKNLVERLISYVARSIALIQCAYDTEVCIIFGNLLDAYPFVADESIRRFEENCTLEPFNRTCKVFVSKMKEKGLVYGAGILALEKHLNNINLL